MTALDYAGGEEYEQASPPPFGHELLKFFAFDDGYINLNHGSFGSLPLPVIAAAERIARESEANPDKFLRFTYQPSIADARAQVARLIGVQTDEVVFVPNATHGLNTVLRNIPWHAGDIMVGASTTYKNVNSTLQYLHDVHPSTVLAPMELAFPTTHDRIRADFRAHLHKVKQTLLSGWTPAPDLLSPEGPKIVAVIDTIVSNPGVLLPWEDLVSIAREEGVWSVVDAAHSLGQEVDIDLSVTKPDFWISNGHKWLYAKRGCAVLYVPFRNQYIIRSSVPTDRFYGTPEPNFVQQHEKTGTLDLTPYLTIQPALAFRRWLGGEHVINAYCHKLAIEGGKRLAEVLGTRLMDETPDAELTLNMVNVELPFTSAALDVVAINRRMLDDYNAFVVVFWHNGRWWTRCSAQVWNEISDFEYVGRMFNQLAGELLDTEVAQ